MMEKDIKVGAERAGRGRKQEARVNTGTPEFCPAVGFGGCGDREHPHLPNTSPRALTSVPAEGEGEPGARLTCLADFLLGQVFSARLRVSWGQGCWRVWLSACSSQAHVTFLAVVLCLVGAGS